MHEVCIPTQQSHIRKCNPPKYNHGCTNIYGQGCSLQHSLNCGGKEPKATDIIGFLQKVPLLGAGALQTEAAS